MNNWNTSFFLLSIVISTLTQVNITLKYCKCSTCSNINKAYTVQFSTIGRCMTAAEWSAFHMTVWIIPNQWISLQYVHNIWTITVIPACIFCLATERSVATPSASAMPQLHGSPMHTSWPVLRVKLKHHNTAGYFTWFGQYSHRTISTQYT